MLVILTGGLTMSTHYIVYRSVYAVKSSKSAINAASDVFGYFSELAVLAEHQHCAPYTNPHEWETGGELAPQG